MSLVEPNEMYKNSVYKNHIEDGKNNISLRCPMCGSKMLDKYAGTFIIMEKMLPEMQQHSEQPDPNNVIKEKITEFYIVENMYAFENIGFTHTVDDCKYLSCADCDGGPVGWFDINTKISYVALSRVFHNN